MKKTAFFFILNLTACNYYSIQNEYKEDVRAGYVIIKSGQCLEFFDLPFLGDFPLKFRYKDHQLMSDKLYKPGHYKVSKQAEILKEKQPCDLDPVRKKDHLEAVNPEKNKENSNSAKNGARLDDKSHTEENTGADNKVPVKPLNPSSEEKKSQKFKDKTKKQDIDEIEVILI